MKLNKTHRLIYSGKEVGVGCRSLASVQWMLLMVLLMIVAKVFWKLAKVA